jgi:hypothetical protein
LDTCNKYTFLIGHVATCLMANIWPSAQRGTIPACHLAISFKYIYIYIYLKKKLKWVASRGSYPSIISLSLTLTVSLSPSLSLSLSVDVTGHLTDLRVSGRSSGQLPLRQSTSGQLTHSLSLTQTVPALNSDRWFNHSGRDLSPYIITKSPSLSLSLSLSISVDLSLSLWTPAGSKHSGELQVRTSLSLNISLSLSLSLTCVFLLFSFVLLIFFFQQCRYKILKKHKLHHNKYKEHKLWVIFPYFCHLFFCYNKRGTFKCICLKYVPICFNIF